MFDNNVIIEANLCSREAECSPHYQTYVEPILLGPLEMSYCVINRLSFKIPSKM